MSAGRPIRSSCSCTAPPMLRGGALVCATCGAAIISAVVDEPDVYGSRAPYAHPPGKSHRWVRIHAREIAGSMRQGGRRGPSVLWLLPRAAYEAHLARRTMVVE